MSSMKFKIGDKDYDAGEALQKVTLATLYELKVRTGIGVKSMAAMAQKISEYENPMDLLEDKEAFQAFRVVIWLARKHAGEHNLTLDQATDFPLDSMYLYNDEQEALDKLQAEAEAGPKVDSAADVSADNPEEISATT